MQGGQRPPAQNYTTTTVTVTVTVTIIITIIFYNLNQAGWPAGLYTKFRIRNSYFFFLFWGDHSNILSSFSFFLPFFFLVLFFHFFLFFSFVCS